jgi:hypothetical protein
MIAAPVSEVAELPAVQLPDERNLGGWLLTRVGSTLDEWCCKRCGSSSTP